MADVTADSVTIYKAEDLSNPQKVDLKNQGVSFFEWMPDRNLALMALYPIHWNGGRWDVTLARYNPEGTTHESDAPIRIFRVMPKSYPLLILQRPMQFT